MSNKNIRRMTSKVAEAPFVLTDYKISAWLGPSALLKGKAYHCENRFVFQVHSLDWSCMTSWFFVKSSHFCFSLKEAIHMKWSWRNWLQDIWCENENRNSDNPNPLHYYCFLVSDVFGF